MELLFNKKLSRLFAKKVYTGNIKVDLNNPNSYQFTTDFEGHPLLISPALSSKRRNEMKVVVSETHERVSSKRKTNVIGE